LLPVPAEKLSSLIEEAAQSLLGHRPVDPSEDVHRTRRPDRDIIGIDVFDGLVRIPFQIPGAIYNGRKL
jgi:hypothetical protein